MNTPTSKRFVSLFVLSIAFASGCSFTQQGIYDGSRQAKIDECNHLPYGQKEVCLEHVPDKHEEYQRNKEELEQE
ncbi:hypothetical protein [Marinimicrobium agarilyticum]|uniref:hypothetical protein n=1 Tax=Marinimicrobium agarilyticum TaxID=306546 RepID=UPI000420262B|nr:hypothetical protein [Marinimicrobium agarilyticum]